MYDFALAANAIALGWALGGLVGLVLFTRWLDRRAGVPFRAALQQIRSLPLSAAVYYGLRWVGCAVVVAAALS